MSEQDPRDTAGNPFQIDVAQLEQLQQEHAAVLKLNREIAEKLYGWQVFDTTHQWEAAGKPSGRDVIVLDQDPRYSWPDYACDHGEALLVLQDLLQWPENRGVSVHIRADKSVPQFVVAFLGTREVAARTLPEAICRFALYRYEVNHKKP